MVAKTTKQWHRPINLGSGEIEMVDNFTYLGSNLARDGQLEQEIDAHIAKTARSFGCIWSSSIFGKLSTPTKRKVYQAIVLPILLYGAETWPVKAIHLKRLTGLHNRCVCTILGVSRYQQWTEHITTTQMNEEFGIPGSIQEIMKHRLHWLGHVARMNADRMPKQILLGELEKTRPAHGTKKRWRDTVKTDLQAIGLQNRLVQQGSGQTGMVCLVQGWSRLTVEHIKQHTLHETTKHHRIFLLLWQNLQTKGRPHPSQAFLSFPFHQHFNLSQSHSSRGSAPRMTLSLSRTMDDLRSSNSLRYMCVLCCVCGESVYVGWTLSAETFHGSSLRIGQMW